MVARTFVKRAVVIAVVLFVVSFALLQFLDWACAQSDPELVGTDDPIPLCRVNMWMFRSIALVPILVTFPAWPLEQWLDAPWDMEMLLLSAIGAAAWAVVLAAGWALLDRYRRRGRIGTVGA